MKEQASKRYDVFPGSRMSSGKNRAPAHPVLSIQPLAKNKKGRGKNSGHRHTKGDKWKGEDKNIRPLVPFMSTTLVYVEMRPARVFKERKKIQKVLRAREP